MLVPGLGSIRGYKAYFLKLQNAAAKKPPTLSNTHLPIKNEYCQIPPAELCEWAHLCFVMKCLLIGQGFTQGTQWLMRCGNQIISVPFPSAMISCHG